MLDALRHEDQVDNLKVALQVATSIHASNPTPESAKNLQDLYELYLKLTQKSGEQTVGKQKVSIDDQFSAAKQSGLFGEPVKMTIGPPTESPEGFTTMDIKGVSEWLKNQKNT